MKIVRAIVRPQKAEVISTALAEILLPLKPESESPRQYGLRIGGSDAKCPYDYIHAWASNPGLRNKRKDSPVNDQYPWKGKISTNLKGDSQ